MVVGLLLHSAVWQSHVKTKWYFGSIFKNTEVKTVSTGGNRPRALKALVTDRVMCQVLAIVDETSKTVSPTGVEVMPALVRYANDTTL